MKTNSLPDGLKNERCINKQNATQALRVVVTEHRNNSTGKPRVHVAEAKSIKQNDDRHKSGAEPHVLDRLERLFQIHCDAISTWK